jgi:exopolysaccharide biosynthesis polyprenyl glycosylphosphotransferase
MTSAANSKGTLILVIGDVLAYIVSLVVTLTIRYGQVPSRGFLWVHISAFSVLFVIFILINLSGGLYDKQSSLIRGRIYGLLLRVQIVNAILGIMFFYFIPLPIAPKFSLFLYFIVSTLLLYLWRIVMFPVVSATRKQNAIIVGSGEDIEDLYEEIDENVRYGLAFKARVAPKSSTNETAAAISEAVKRANASIIVANLHDPSIEMAMPFLYSLVFSGVQVIDASKLYEVIFDRIPLSMVGERWLVENSGTALGNRIVYDSVKRAIDIVIGCVGSIIPVILLPFVYIAVKLEDRGPVFITQERIGKNGKTVKIIKFRSMSGDDKGKYGENGATKLSVTHVGRFVRSTRIDEWPQMWNVVKGDLSLTGPRPELPALAAVYEKEVPYYNARHLVKPGLSGWAQIYHENHPHHETDATEARNKLYYDFYYVKNRSLALDLKIILRTLQILLKRAGK